MPSAGVMSHLQSIQTITVTTQVWAERQIPQERTAPALLFSAGDLRGSGGGGEGHELLHTGPLGTAAGSWQPRGWIRSGEPGKLHNCS